MNSQTNAIDTGGPPRGLPEAVDQQPPTNATSMSLPSASALDGGAAPDWPTSAIEGKPAAPSGAVDLALDAGGAPRHLVDAVGAGALPAESLPRRPAETAIDTGGPAAALVEEVEPEH